MFCQKGQIKVPHAYQPLFDYLESTVHEVALPQGRGVFHPKTWLLRYVDLEDDGPVRYRFVCLTRNLTFDSEWDTMVALDGVLTERRNAYARNHPLGDFIAALPRLHGARLPPVTDEIMETLQDEVRRVDFEVPKPFSEVAFHPLGLSRRSSWPFPQNERQRLVMSPFLSTGFLERFASKGRGHVLISRADQLAAVGPAKLGGYGELYELDTGRSPRSLMRRLRTLAPTLMKARACRASTPSCSSKTTATRPAFGPARPTPPTRRSTPTWSSSWSCGRDDGQAASKPARGGGLQTCLRALLRRVHPTTLVPPPTAQSPKADRRGACCDRRLRPQGEGGARRARTDLLGEAASRAGTDLAEGRRHVATAKSRPRARRHWRPRGSGVGEVARFDDVSYEGLTLFFAIQVTAKADGQRARVPSSLRPAAGGAGGASGVRPGQATVAQGGLPALPVVAAGRERTRHSALAPSGRRRRGLDGPAAGPRWLGSGPARAPPVRTGARPGQAAGVAEVVLICAPATTTTTSCQMASRRCGARSGLSAFEGGEAVSQSRNRPDVEAVLSGLKDFQRASVDYVFKRMYLDQDPARRFLIADEVGLGKTLVARGLIARAIDHLLG